MLDALKYVLDIEVRDDGRAGCRVVVLKAQCCGLSDVVIDAAIQSVSAT